MKFCLHIVNMKSQISQCREFITLSRKWLSSFRTKLSMDFSSALLIIPIAYQSHTLNQVDLIHHKTNVYLISSRMFVVIEKVWLGPLVALLRSMRYIPKYLSADCKGFSIKNDDITRNIILRDDFINAIRRLNIRLIVVRPVWNKKVNRMYAHR